MAGSAATPAVRCRNRRRANSVPFTPNGWPCGMAALTGRRCVRLLFDTIGGVPGLLLRLSLMPTTPSFVPLVALGERYTDCRCARKGLAAGCGPLLLTAALIAARRSVAIGGGPDT